MAAEDYCVFEYLYRDAGNFKAHGALLLEGVLSDVDIALLRGRLDGGEFFIAEQIGVPTLYQQLWDECDCEPSDEMDHVWHEFGEIRLASADDLAVLPRWGRANDFKMQLLRIRRWDETLSCNWPA
ncbi:hypothetical protein [Denitromonas halophila]|uniref:Uncharacterized protein n=1 Tax=Denitromonas halophila TaxID=1629404 RepID=A0A557QC50_9RHOO|nr:hypothetical protein [Denitromonas halophila]TVO50477.1 hypothetical protein FHP91_21030 [Denitromonas halophila]